MVQLTPQSRIFVATKPVDFRTGIDGLAAVCRHVLGAQPRSGAVFVFRNRAATAITLLLYDGQGFWLCTTRLSQGRFHWCTHPQGARARLAARERQILLWNGHPDQARMAEDWRQLTSGGTRLA